MSNKETASGAPAVRSDREYEYWRWRILIGTMIGYIFFYFVRKSITMAMPGLEELGITKTTLGGFLTIHGVLYGVARFVNGVWSDRVNARYFMSIGLFLAAMTNVFCGFSQDIASALFPEANQASIIAWIIGSFWIINGWVQGMGFPPCAKSLMHWFAPREHGIKFATWNISHSFGAGLVFLLNSFVVLLGWKYCFLVPAALSLLGAIFLFWALRDSPEKEGFEPVEVYYERTHGGKSELAEKELSKTIEAATAQEEEKTSWWDDLCKNVFSNWAVWVLCFANFFVYIVRFSILDWAPTFLSQSKGLNLQSAGWATACYEVFGAFGIILSGVMMDKIFKGRGAKACFVYMLGCGIASFVFWRLDSASLVLNILLLSLIGFFIYGPQCLIGCVASTIATKKSGAASSGLTGLFGYLATIVTGLGVGIIVDGATAIPKHDRDMKVAAAVLNVTAAPSVPSIQENQEPQDEQDAQDAEEPQVAQDSQSAEEPQVAQTEQSSDEPEVAQDAQVAEEPQVAQEKEELKIENLDAETIARLEAIVASEDFNKLVKTAESYADLQIARDTFAGDKESSKYQELDQKYSEAEYGLEGLIRTVGGDSSFSQEALSRVSNAAYVGRGNITKAGWPRIFLMLVFSSVAALILFALIFNAASPEVLREEAERRRLEEEAKKSA